ncbi:hypothetical protein IJU85_02335 [Candidatus Saccharibacteria bacterium]|nr:hypothetical protein [Candidatus Saccharibacteria bacterium]
MGINDASAITFQNNVDVEFTFNSTLSISLSSADLLIANLAPGASASSNTITVSVNTNNITGYTLSAKVGDGTTYTNGKLTNATSSTVFNNLSSSSNLTLAQFNDNVWGYALGTIDSNTTYSGLVYNRDTIINATTNNTGTAASSGCVSTCSGTNSTYFTIAAKASSTQASGDYSNVIIFTVVGNRPPEYLYDKVAELSRGTLAQNNISLTDAITTPTSTNKATDTSNSGVFIYDATLRGAVSDASNDHTIYFYRGILETNPGTYGSAGSANAYPNYVKLSNNTCWRIVRTTGSGGVKMIYNGIWINSAWTDSSCANSSSSTQLTTRAFASQGTSAESDWYNNMAYVGYTFNNDVTDSTTNTPLSTILGSDTYPEYNNARSNIKTYIEDTWYASNMTAYTNKLEASAGYCADRTVYNTSNVLQSESTETLPYSTTTYYFGAKVRSTIAGATPSYACPRSTVDLYHYVANSTGVSNELKYPAALLTADEVALAGSGYGASSTNYSAQSFLRSGSSFWLLSPDSRFGHASVFFLNNSGALDFRYVDSTFGVRPAISLIPGTVITGGSGTATDPWTVE